MHSLKVIHGIVPDKDYNFSATPDNPYRQYKRKRRPQEPNWVAPEHQKFAKHMQRAFPIAHDGRKMTELGKELVLDPRPEIMQPKRESFSLGIST